MTLLSHRHWFLGTIERFIRHEVECGAEDGWILGVVLRKPTYGTLPRECATVRRGMANTLVTNHYIIFWRLVHDVLYAKTPKECGPEVKQGHPPMIRLLHVQNLLPCRPIQRTFLSAGKTTRDPRGKGCRDDTDRRSVGAAAAAAVLAAARWLQ